MTLTIVGLGPGSIDDLTRKAWQVLEQAEHVYVWSKTLGCVPDLPQTGVHYHYLENHFANMEDFEAVFAAIVQYVLDAAHGGDVVYAVPGDPMMGDATVTQLLAEAKAAGIPVEIVSGVSFIQPVLAQLGLDGLEGLQIVNGLSLAAMYHPPINPAAPALVGLIYNPHLAHSVQKVLRNQYPADFEVTLIHAAGRPDVQVETVRLDALADSPHIGEMTALFIPAWGEMASFEQFQEIIAHLRAPEGCPWDRKQTHLTLRPYLLEESYEVLDAIDNGDMQALAEELGDVLLQVILHTQIATENGAFQMVNVLDTVNRKMIRRHPHVWGEVTVNGSDEVVVNWDAIKKQEKADNGTETPSVLDSIPGSLPALLKAYRYQARAAKFNFDWEQVGDVIAKVHEEIDELIAAETEAERVEELGDVLFVLVNWARWLEIDPEMALRATNDKFYRRFRYIEEQVAKNGKQLTDHTLEELDAFWDEAKAQGV